MDDDKTLKVSAHEGAFGPPRGYLVESVVRAIAESHQADLSAWPSKYGAAVENETFSMHPFCWCEEEKCPWCGPDNAPNFHYKPLDFKLWWYKYIGRGMEANREVSPSECAEMLARCLPLAPQGTLENGTNFPRPA
jgi:hypothetical protein